MNRFTRLLAVLLPLVGVAALVPAQIEPVPTTYVVTTGDSVAMRCAPNAAWYTVAQLEAGTILKVDGRSGGWLQVAYPKGIPAIVVAEEAALNEAQGTVELVEKSQLRAFNRQNPTSNQAYRNLLMPDEALPAGTKLEYIDIILNNSGITGGYRVVPPVSARGFVLEEQTRAATAEEKASVLPPTQPEAGSGGGAQPERFGAGEAGDDSSDPERAEPENMSGEGSGGDAEAGASGESMQDDGSAGEESGEPSGDDGSVQPVELPELPVDLDLLAELNEAFERVGADESTDAEYRELARQYEALIEGVDPEDPLAAGVVNSVRARIDILEIRAELQESAREIAEIRVRAEQVARDALDRTQQIAREQRVYDVVGILTASSVYVGGEGLPKLYRIQASDRGIQRTLAYVRVPADDSIDRLLGRVVGVRLDGNARRNASQVPMVSPDQLDVISAQSAEVGASSSSGDGSESGDDAP